jgi:hypothetical protein
LAIYQWGFKILDYELDNSNMVIKNIISNNKHNAFTDIISWNDSKYLAFRESLNHISHQSKILIFRSTNNENWENIHQFSLVDGDVRDPKFAVIDGNLFIYILRNDNVAALPNSTYFSYTNDGTNWAQLQRVYKEGWNFWRPKSFDMQTWYVAAYNHEKTKSILLESQDGIFWKETSTIYNDRNHSEVEIEFTKIGNMICSIRKQGAFSSSTIIGFSEFPYQEWNFFQDKTIRLDGPRLFRIDESIYAIARSDFPIKRGIFHTVGGILNRKRTSLFQISESGLIKDLTDFPSAGDTSYAGITIFNENIFISYYSSGLDYDLPWFIGHFFPTNIYVIETTEDYFRSIILK